MPFRHQEGDVIEVLSRHRIRVRIFRQKSPETKSNLRKMRRKKTVVFTLTKMGLKSGGKMFYKDSLTTLCQRIKFWDKKFLSGLSR